ncbi:coiled-coil domain-containing protein [Roseitranquillus sediminis]|uniref:hypothetical protein n=1 Tax=Roseitranquillus sediminis TaxID=2809051 RepID=UPI001D0C113E|nr:hypothetical protein [Roseitranquillus sediminis]MBM9593595.1 hypothetical protein [Roseitranquillus sediminis]
MFDASEACAVATASLSEAGRAISRDYERMIPLIGRVRDAVGAIVAQSDQLVRTIEAADGAADAALIDERTLDEICATSQCASEALADAGLIQCTQHLGSCLKDAGRHTLELSIVSVLVKTSAPPTDAARGDTSDFATMVDDLVRRLDVAIGEAGRQVGPIREHISAAGIGVSVAARSLRDARQKCGAESAETTALFQSRTRYLGNLKATSQELAITCGGQIGRLVPALQFSDELSQRIGNLVRIAAEIEARGPASQQAARALMTAQLASLVEDHRNVAAAAADALDRMSEATAQAASVLAPGAAPNSAERWLDDRRARIARISEAVSAARARLGVAGDLLDAVARSGERASTAIADFQALIAQLDLAAVNAAIAAGRASEAGGALQFLSGQVQQAARSCASRLRDSRAALETIGAGLEAVDRRPLMDGLDVLSQSQAASEEAVRQQDAQLKRQAEVRADLARGLRSLGENARKARQLIQHGTAAEARLSHLLRQTPPVSPAERGSAAWLWDCYTTEAERRVHRDFIGEDAAPEPAVDAGELDDFLL